MNEADPIEQFDAHLKASGYSRHTRRAYRCDLDGLVRFCRERNLSLRQIGPHELDAFLNSTFATLGPQGHERAPGAINRVRASLRAVFSWLRDTGQIRANPTAALKSRPPHLKMPEILSQPDEARLLKILEVSGSPLAFRDRVMVEMLLRTGMRIGEMVRLNVDDLDLSARLATIQAKGGTVQVRHIREALALLLERYLRWREKLPEVSSALFVSGTGRRITDRHFARRLASWLEDAGIEAHVTAHTFRHTLARRLLDATGNLRLVQQALGHRSIASTIRYTHVPSETLKAALEAV